MGFFNSYEPTKYEPEESGGEQIVKAGKKVICSHCGHDRFLKGDAQLNTAGMTFFGFDWLNKTATVLVCTECGHIEWFV